MWDHLAVAMKYLAIGVLYVASVADYLVVAVIGVVLGVAELSSRYRDAPLRALKTLPALSYISLNLAASVGCLWLIRHLNIDFDIKDPSNRQVTQVLVSGFGAMAFFRSSFFVFRAGNQDISVGPASVLQILLSALDNAVDRVRAEQRAERIEEIMEDVSFGKAKDVLPPIAIALMRNLPREDADRMSHQISVLKEQLPERTKAVALGLAVLDVVGEKVLRSAVKLVKSDIRRDPRKEELLKAGYRELLAVQAVAPPLSPQPPPAAPPAEGTGTPPIPPGDIPPPEGSDGP